MKNPSYLLEKVKNVIDDTLGLVRKIPNWVYFCIIFLVATILRFKQYLANRSFWLDEAALAVNIQERDYEGLLQPLEYRQVAPIGFLRITKLFTNSIGDSELVYRFIPFLSGVLFLLFLYLYNEFHRKILKSLEV